MNIIIHIQNVLNFRGLNGTIDIDKPISIVIAPISFEE